MSHPPHIVVVGSLNMDLVVTVPKIPQPGETVLGTEFVQNPGGKGANQAVAAARLGGRVSLIGRVGQDAFGAQLLAQLAEEAVDVTWVQPTPSTSTGVALISVAESGENSIAVASGANALLTPEDIAAAWPALEPVDYLVAPLETPLATVQAAAELAYRAGARVILNPAPARPLPAELLALIDILVPNETETAQLTGRPIGTERELEIAARHLLGQGIGEVVLTLGGRGVMWVSGGKGGGTAVHFPAHQVSVVDTTAAGDAFVAGLAVALSEGKALDAAVQFANGVGALTCTQLGAQAALPTRAAVEEFLA